MLTSKSPISFGPCSETGINNPATYMYPASARKKPRPNQVEYAKDMHKNGDEHNVVDNAKKAIPKQSIAAGA